MDNKVKQLAATHTVGEGATLHELDPYIVRYYDDALKIFTGLANNAVFSKSQEGLVVGAAAQCAKLVARLNELETKVEQLRAAQASKPAPKPKPKPKAKVPAET